MTQQDLGNNTEEDQREFEDMAQEKGEESVADEDKETTRPGEDYKAKYFYLAAETENLRKRLQREKDQVVKFANERVLSSLIDVLDNFERTIDAIQHETDEKVKNIKVGIEMVRNQFAGSLQEHGLKKVESVGKQFDPNYHEALDQKETHEHEEGTVVHEYQKGYTLNGRLLRPSKVSVAKKKEEK